MEKRGRNSDPREFDTNANLIVTRYDGGRKTSTDFLGY